MKDNLYIRFKEGNIESLNKACNKAKELGYEELDSDNALDFE
jgi:hypothetical protein